MLCTDIKCSKVVGKGLCSVYPPAGQKFRDRQGYCPIPDAGPNKEVHVVQGAKIRAGQQKHKKA